jgi:hypothetical protein
MTEISKEFQEAIQKSALDCWLSIPRNQKVTLRMVQKWLDSLSDEQLSERIQQAFPHLPAPSQNGLTQFREDFIKGAKKALNQNET